MWVIDGVVEHLSGHGLIATFFSCFYLIHHFLLPTLALIVHKVFKLSFQIQEGSCWGQIIPPLVDGMCMFLRISCVRGDAYGLVPFGLKPFGSLRLSSASCVVAAVGAEDGPCTHRNDG